MGAITIPDTPAEEPAVEWRRLGKAVASVRRTISQLRIRTARDVGEAEAAIFDAHQLLLDDAALLAERARAADAAADTPPDARPRSRSVAPAGRSS